MRTETEKLKKQEKERDFFCVVSDAFRVFARRSSSALGSAWAFVGAVLVILVWIVTGPMFHFSDTWQLVINTATTIVTFLMVFLIQNTQNRDSIALHLKLDELIRSLDAARNGLIDVEDLSDEEIEKLQASFHKMRATRGQDVGECIKSLEEATNEESDSRKARKEKRDQGSKTLANAK